MTTYDFFKKVIGFDLANFMTDNQAYFQAEIYRVLEQLMRAE